MPSNVRLPLLLKQHRDLVTIFGLALLVRLIHHFLIRDNFWFQTPLVDDKVYMAWAQDIINGDWLLRSKGPFRFNPGYPYFLALVYSIVGKSLESVVLIQHQLGALGCVLIAWLGQKLFTKPVGWVAGGLLAFYGPAIFFEDRLLAPSPVLLANLAMLCFIVKGFDNKKRLTWFFAGLFCGVSWIFHPGIALFAGLFILWLSWKFVRGTFNVFFILSFLGGIMLLVGPCMLRNAVVDRSAQGLTTTTTVGGIAFYIGNNPHSNGADAMPSFIRYSPDMDKDFKREAEKRLATTLAPSMVSDYWFRESWKWIFTHPQDFAVLMGRKLVHFANNFEVQDNFPPDELRPFQRLAGLPFLSWGVIFPLGVAGGLLAWPTRKKSWVLYLYFAAAFAFTMAFFVLARYRFPAVPVLILFTAFALVEGFRLIRAHRYRSLAAAAGVAVLLLYVSNTLVKRRAEEPWVNYLSKAIAYKQGGRFEESMAAYQRALDLHPNDPALLKGLSEAAFSASRYDVALQSLESLEGHFGRNDPWIVLSQGQTHFRRGDFQSAVRSFEKLTQLLPKDPDAFLALGQCRWMLADKRGAVKAVQRAVELDPTNEGYRRTLEQMRQEMVKR